MLEQRRKPLNEQVEARSEQLAESVALLQEDAQITGEVLRIERKPENKILVHSAFYRESPNDQQIQRLAVEKSRFMVGRMDGTILPTTHGIKFIRSR